MSLKWWTSLKHFFNSSLPLLHIYISNFTNKCLVRSFKKLSPLDRSWSLSSDNLDLAGHGPASLHGITSTAAPKHVKRVFKRSFGGAKYLCYMIIYQRSFFDEVPWQFKVIINHLNFQVSLLHFTPVLNQCNYSKLAL